MSFLPKSPLISSEAKTIPASIPSGTRALFARNDGWYEMDSKGNVKKISPDGNNSSETACVKMIGTFQNKNSEIILLEFPDGGEENGWEEVKVNYEEIEALYNSGKNICIEFELRHYLQSTTSSNILPTTSFCKLQLDTINTGKGYAYFSNIINIPNVYNDFDKNYVLIVKFEKNKDVDAVLYKLNDMRQIKENESVSELIVTGQTEVTFDGKFEDVEVYNTSHTFNEILTAYNEGKKILLNLDITNIENTNLLLPLIAINETGGCIFAQSFSYPQKENINNFHVGWHSNDVISLLRTELASQFYVDVVIGDIESSLENIINKYGLGGEAS